MPLPLASQPETHVCWGEWRLELGVYRTDLWGGLGSVAQRQPEGAVAQPQPGVSMEEAQAHHKSKAPWLSVSEGRGRSPPPTATSFSTCQPPWPPGGCTPASACASSPAPATAGWAPMLAGRPCTEVGLESPLSPKAR